MRHRGWILAALLTGGLVACDDTTSGPDLEPASLVAVGGSGQDGAPGAALPQPFVVEARASDGTPVAGVDLTWQVVQGGGELEETATRTGANGRSSITYTLGPNPGVNVVRVFAPGLGIDDAEFSATAGGGVAVRAR